MMNLNHLKKKLILRKEKLTLKILRKENLKIMKMHDDEDDNDDSFWIDSGIIHSINTVV